MTPDPEVIHDLREVDLEQEDLVPTCTGVEVPLGSAPTLRAGARAR